MMRYTYGLIEKNKHFQMKKLRFFFSIIFICCLYSCERYESEPISGWTQLERFPGGARASAVSFVYGTKAYVGLGRTGLKEGFLKDLWEFDSETGKWTRKSDFPGKARVKAVCGVIGDKAYIGLGTVAAYDTTSQFSDLWEYDIKNDAWTRKASFPGEGKNDLFCAVVDSCLYTTEGFTNTRFVPDTYKYDSRTDKWTRLADCPIYHGCTAGFTIGQYFYVGTGFRGMNFKDFYRFDTMKEKWSRVADLPEGRILSKGITIDGKGYIMLGRYWNGALNGGRLLSDIVEYDPNENTWIKKGDFPGGARQNIVAFSIDGKGYIMTGEDDNERKSDVWMFEP